MGEMISDTIPWIIKYAPKSELGLVGQQSALKQLNEFIKNYKSQKKKAALLSGPSGCGKTSSVLAVANSIGLEVIEVNASDFRNKLMINQTIGNSIKQRSLFYSGKIILLDEVDGLSGKEDRGAISELIKLLDESTFPVVCTAYNAYEDKLRSLRSKSVLIDFDIPDYKDVFSVLKKISVSEKIIHNDDDLKTIARRSGGDFRAAINDLQLLSTSGRIDKDSIDELWQRNKVESMPSALVKVLKNTDPEIAINAFENVEEDLDQAFLWLDENIPKEYKSPVDLALAYDKLSKADVFRGRIRRWQHWRFLVYVNALLTAGVAVSKKEKNPGFVKYAPTSRILKIWIANRKYEKRKAICQKIAEKTHTSTKRVIQDTFPYIQAMIMADKKLAVNLSHYFDLDSAEVEWLAK